MAAKELKLSGTLADIDQNGSPAIPLRGFRVDRNASRRARKTSGVPSHVVVFEVGSVMFIGCVLRKLLRSWVKLRQFAGRS
jgi:hypothetical protein